MDCDEITEKDAFVNNTPYIKAEHVSFAYKNDDSGDVQVLRDVSFEIARGEFVAVLGHNGSGKSTLAKLLNMILSPSEGRIYIDGEEITSPDFTEEDLFRIRRKIGMVFQNPDNQLVATIVEEDIAFGPENLGTTPAEIRARVDEALAAVGMTAFARHSPHQLSGGQKQRIAIAGIIAMLPECIIFDESTAMLDPSGREEVMETIEKLNRERGITVLHITHNMNEAVRADRILVVNDGQILIDGKPREVFSHVEELKAVGLDVPQVTELMWKLRGQGIALPANIIDEEEGADLLASLIRGEQSK
ncbi:MAG: energy-coupling factor transporter ATPase [Clostridia bacterium]|nr:energy-coupling factor transporter ATPase [Clostridia bacterium]